jgi:Protein of unknown function (DUF5818)
MSRITVWSAAALLAFAALAYAGSKEISTFRGEIADSQCALNVHSLTRSHQEMLKAKSMGGTALSCAVYCVRYMGGNFVLTSGKHVYHLDNQELVQKFIAQRVKIFGTLDQKTNTLHVEKIDADE